MNTSFFNLSLQGTQWPGNWSVYETQIHKGFLLKKPSWNDNLTSRGMREQTSSNQPILLTDGLCSLCQRIWKAFPKAQNKLHLKTALFLVLVSELTWLCVCGSSSFFFFFFELKRSSRLVAVEGNQASSSSLFLTESLSQVLQISCLTSSRHAEDTQQPEKML